MQWANEKRFECLSNHFDIMLNPKVEASKAEKLVKLQIFL